MDRLAHQIPDLKRDDLVRPVLDQFVVDLRADVFLSAEDGLDTSVIVV
nr:MAG TPA: hypothetical protein [Caudoviricetes sp.]